MGAENFLINGLSMSYVFTFDLGSEGNINLNNEQITKSFGSYMAGTCFVGKGEIRTYEPDKNVEYLKAYNAEMYQTRFKKPHLNERNILLLQIPSQELRGLSSSQNELVPPEKVVKFDCTISLNEMGIGSIVFWVEMDKNLTFNLEQLQKLRDVDGLTTKVDWRLGPEKKYRLNGCYTFLDLARFIIVTTYLSIYRKKINYKVLQKKFDSNETIKNIHLYLCQVCSGKMKISSDILTYPIFHLNFSNAVNGDNQHLGDFILRNKSLIRGLVSGDINWDKKNEEVVNKLLTEHSFSTRKSIYWFTYPNGSMKLYSSQLETSLLTSKVLITFELEITLTMKHFLYKMIQNLNRFSDLSRKMYPMRSVAKLRDKEMHRLDEYYNLDFLQKDTTISRLDKYKKMFKVEEILQIVEKKFKGLDAYMNTEYQNASSKRQLILTVIFGAFGAGNLTFSIIRKGIEDKVFICPFDDQILFTLSVMLIVTLTIYLVSKRMIRVN